jgi:hypothetical protein
MTWLHAVVDVPEPLHKVSEAFWSAALGWAAGRPWDGHPELRSLEPPDGDAYVHLQRIDGPPRVHLDVESTDPQAAAARAVAAGAPVLRRAEHWVTLRSPGGLPFCILQERARTAPEPAAWPDGHRSRLVQVCIDSPTARHDAEVSFWRSLLGGRWVSSPAAEFAGKWHDDAGSPLQLLFQRLEEPDGEVRAHLDVGTDARPAEVRRLSGLGADDLGAGRGGWHVLRDPAGLTFCVTDNAPDQTRRRDLG